MTLDFSSKVQNLALIFGIDLAQPHMWKVIQQVTSDMSQLSPSMAPQDSNRAKLGPERGTKQLILPHIEELASCSRI